MITTKSLTLKPTILSDAADIQAYFNNWEIIKWLRPPVPWPYPENGAEQHLKEVAKNPAWHSFSIRLHGSDKVIGSIRYERHEDKDTIYAERGFVLDPQYWGKGLATEAADALNNYVFSTTDITEIRANNAIGNIPSSKIKQKQGFILQDIVDIDPPYHSGTSKEEEWVLPKTVWVTKSR
jgi:RimJ/RimL family protein N-acetyltransferase